MCTNVYSQLVVPLRRRQLRARVSPGGLTGQARRSHASVPGQAVHSGAHRGIRHQSAAGKVKTRNVE